MTGAINTTLTPTDTTLTGLDQLLGLLENGDLVKSKQRKDFRGSKKADLLIGSDRNNTISGKVGNDVLQGKAGDDKLDGGNGNDLLVGGEGNDTLAGGNNTDVLFGNVGDDLLDGGNGNDSIDGGNGIDTLVGGSGDDILVGGNGVDTLTGGAGRDRFGYSGNPFANGTPAPTPPLINVLGQPDIIKDYTIGEDQFVLNGEDLGIKTLTFQKGLSSQITNGNAIVLTDSFAAAGAAARAIANNPNITADEGVFVYFNTTLGLSRTVYSKDLGDGGDISILANLDNQRGTVGQANLASFSAADFSLG